MEYLFELDKNSKIPIHQQLYCYIKECIEKNIYKENESIPSENEMQQLFGVSRITVRRAISDLEHDGYLRKRRGRGTLVEPRKIERNISTFNGFSKDTKGKGNKPGSIILACKEIEPSVKVAEKLEINFGEKVYYIKRLRLINGRIIGLHQSYVSQRFGFEINEADFDSTTSLYEFIENKGITLGCADEVLEAKMASQEIKHELFLEENQPVVCKERVTYDNNHLPVEYSENTYIADTYKYSIHIVNVRD